jgi:tetratricopeptide (TPR) repeat protein
VLPFANRAMFLNPSLGQPHLLVARALRATGHAAQAGLEYRLAWERGGAAVVSEIARAFSTPEQLLAAVPSDPQARAALADTLIAAGKLELAAQVARASAAEAENAPALIRMARLALMRKEPDEAIRLGERIGELAPDQPVGLTLRVEALQQKGEVPKAVALLDEEGVRRFPLNAELVLRAAALKLSLGDTKGCRESLKRLPVGLNVGLRVQALVLESGAHERDGQGTKAIAQLRSAAMLNPRDPGLRWALASLMERLGRLDQAVREGEEAAAMSSAYAPLAEQLRQRTAQKKKQLEDLERWREVNGPDPAAPRP